MGLYLCIGRLRLGVIWASQGSSGKNLLFHFQILSPLWLPSPVCCTSETLTCRLFVSVTFSTPAGTLGRVWACLSPSRTSYSQAVFAHWGSGQLRLLVKIRWFVQDKGVLPSCQDSCCVKGSRCSALSSSHWTVISSCLMPVLRGGVTVSISPSLHKSRDAKRTKSSAGFPWSRGIFPWWSRLGDASPSLFASYRRFRGSRKEGFSFRCRSWCLRNNQQGKRSPRNVFIEGKHVSTEIPTHQFKGSVFQCAFCDIGSYQMLWGERVKWAKNWENIIYFSERFTFPQSINLRNTAKKPKITTPPKRESKTSLIFLNPEFSKVEWTGKPILSNPQELLWKLLLQISTGHFWKRMT